MGHSVSTVIVLIIIAILKTSLSEEILFRGFIAKRFISYLGFVKGNIIQSLIFGAIHVFGIYMIAKPSFFLLLFVFFFSSTAGFVLGYIKERQGNGSIISGWLAHGFANLVAFYISAFVL